MRDYGKVSPQFWTGKTGKTLRGNPTAQVVALYLMTSPHANMIGVYHLPILYLAHETGLSEEWAQAGLQACADAGFCTYDPETETVFVVEMAAHQVGETLKPNDLRAKSIERLYRGIASPEIASAFHVRYGEPFNLGSPLQAPSKGDSKGLYKPQHPVTAPVTAPVEEGGVGETVSIPLDDGSEHSVTAADLAEYRAAYPRIDVLAELRKARAWSLSNVANRKTRRGVGKFVNGWLSRANDKAAQNAPKPAKVRVQL